MKYFKESVVGILLLAAAFFFAESATAETRPYLFAEILPATGGTGIEDLNFRSIIPQPIQNLADKAETFEVNLDELPNLKSAVESVRGVVGNPADIIEDPGSWWTRINNWLRAKVGFDLRQVAKAIGMFFLWFLDLLKELASWVISKL